MDSNIFSQEQTRRWLAFLIDVFRLRGTLCNVNGREFLSILIKNLQKLSKNDGYKLQKLLQKLSNIECVTMSVIAYHTPTIFSKTNNVTIIVNPMNALWLVEMFNNFYRDQSTDNLNTLLTYIQLVCGISNTEQLQRYLFTFYITKTGAVTTLKSINDSHGLTTNIILDTVRCSLLFDKEETIEEIGSALHKSIYALRDPFTKQNCQ